MKCFSDDLLFRVFVLWNINYKYSQCAWEKQNVKLLVQVFTTFMLKTIQMAFFPTHNLKEVAGHSLHTLSSVHIFLQMFSLKYV